ncbi:MAG: sulfite exporter TauE/SafE family protein [Rhizobiaceae bacterium]
MTPDIAFYLLAIPAVVITGLSKGGFASGVGMLGTPLLALAVPPMTAAGIMLPILLVMDAIGLYSYRRTVNWPILAHMLPGAFVGIALGWATVSQVNEDVIRLLIGAIALIFAINQMVADYRGRSAGNQSAARATLWSTCAGYTSFVLHAGGPPFQAYVLPLKLDKLEYTGTSVVFFALVNAVKVIPYFLLGQFGTQNLYTSATLLPLAIASVWLGIWAVRRLSQQFFYKITYLAMILVGSKLVYDALVKLA